MPVRNFLHICWLMMVVSLVAEDRAYRDEIRKWRADYEDSLKRDNGWLTLAGLFWLKEGDNRFGTGSGNDLILPDGSAPEAAGTFVLHDGKTRLRLKAGVQAFLNGAPVLTETALKPDSAGSPDRVTLGHLSMIAIQRGSRYGIRLWDNQSAVRRDFQGTRWFPAKESYRITARFVIIPAAQDDSDSQHPRRHRAESQPRLCRV